MAPRTSERWRRNTNDTPFTFRSPLPWLWKKTRGRAASALSNEFFVVAVLAMLALYGFFYEYLPPFDRLYLWSDVAGYHYPLHRFAFQVLKEGRIPLWDSSIYCGITLIGNVQAALLYPPTWLMYAAVWSLPRFPFKALEVFTFAHVWLGFVLCYLWLRGRTGKLASGLGAAVFAFSGYMLWETLHPGALAAMAWMPGGFWGIDRTVDRRDWRCLWAVAVSSTLSFLAGYPSAWIVTCVMFLVYALGSRRHLRAAMGVSIALIASALLSCAQLLPAMQARSMMVPERDYGPAAWGLRSQFLSYFIPNWFDFNPGHRPDYEPGCMYLYLGLPALFAVVWVIRRHNLRPYLQPVTGLAIAFLLANPPLYLIHTVERFKALDCTIQSFNFYSAVAAMASLITAISVNDFLHCSRKERISFWTLFGTATALSLWSLHQLWILWTGGGVFATGTRSLIQTLLALVFFSCGLWCIKHSVARNRIVLTVILLLATAIDYKVYGSGRWFNAISGSLDTDTSAYGIAGLDDTAYRAMLTNRQYREVTDDLAGPHPVQYRLFGLTTPEGFDPFLPVQYKKTIEHWVPFRTNRLFYTDVLNDEMLQALGVRYVLVRKGVEHDPVLATDPRFRLIGRKDIFCHVYEYLAARPPYHWNQDQDGTANVITWIPERREFLAHSDRGGRFVLVEQFFPGWRVMVDGHSAEIERWGGAFQAVRLTAGEHHVIFEFRPVSLKVGAGVSIVALAGFLAMVRADKRSKRQVTSC